MGVTPVRALNSIKPDGIWGVENSPVVFWILRIDPDDSTVSKRLTSLAENFQSKCSPRKSTSLALTGSFSEINDIAKATPTTIKITNSTTEIITAA